VNHLLHLCGSLQTSADRAKLEQDLHFDLIDKVGLRLDLAPYGAVPEGTWH
jgi:hypothetical protein